MVDHGFNKTKADHCVFVKKYDGGDILILLLYIDDMLIVEQNVKKIGSLKQALNKSFTMKDTVQHTACRLFPCWVVDVCRVGLRFS